MDASDFALLGVLPCIVWSSFYFVLFSRSKIAQKLRTSWNAKTKEEIAEGSRWWTVQTLATLGAVFVTLLLWGWLQGSPLPAHALHDAHYPYGVFDGLILGLAIVGGTIFLRIFFYEPQRFTLPALIGVGSSGPMCAAALLAIAFTEEFWRALCLKDLMAKGLSGPEALLLTSIAYGLAYLAWGLSTAISVCILGAALGALFIWTNSLYVPFAAHLTFLTQVLLYSLAAVPEARPADLHRKRIRKCPACRATLTLEQIDSDPDEAFFCAYCRERLTVADWRRGFFGRGYVLYGVYAILLEFAGQSIADRRIKSPTVAWIVIYVIPLLAIFGLSSFLKVLFPVSLQVESGDPSFIELKLGEKRHRAETEGPPKQG